MEAVFDARSILCLILFHLNSNSPLMFDSKLINLVPGLQFEKGHEPTNSIAGTIVGPLESNEIEVH